MKSPDCQNVPLWLPEKVWVVYFENNSKYSISALDFESLQKDATFLLDSLRNICDRFGDSTQENKNETTTNRRTDRLARNVCLGVMKMCCYISGAFTIQDGRSRHIFDFCLKEILHVKSLDLSEMFLQHGTQNVKTHNRTTKKTETIINTDPPKTGSETRVLVKGKQFLLLIRHKNLYRT
jgi:predicted metal-binding transcription factor (methanogenesis marker protein 9)